MNTTLQVKDCVKFILQHRRGKAFQDWSIPEIIVRISKGIHDNTFCYCSENGTITGIMLGELRGSKFHISNMLSTRNHIHDFFTFIANTQPHITHITAIRHGRFNVEFDATGRNYLRFILGSLVFMKGTK